MGIYLKVKVITVQKYACDISIIFNILLYLGYSFFFCFILV